MAIIFRRALYIGIVDIVGFLPNSITLGLKTAALIFAVASYDCQLEAEKLSTVALSLTLIRHAVNFQRFTAENR